MNRHPLYAFVLALVFGFLGYKLLAQGNLLVGAFAFWACGVNTALTIKNGVEAYAEIRFAKVKKGR